MSSHTRKLLAVACAAFALQALPGCQNGNGGSSVRENRESRSMNRQNAQALIKEAEEAERQGNYQLAMEKYQLLRAFPEPSRPNDLDRRMERLQQRMNRPAGR